MCTTALPPVPEVIAAEYQKLIADLDSAIFTVQQHLQDCISCAPGCSSCCRRFSVLPLEAALIADSAGFPLHPPGRGEYCPHLNDNRCSIYPQRPLICRSQGLPIGYIDEDRAQIEVSACPLNFPEDHPFALEDLLLLDAFNSRLAALNSSYCLMAGIAAGTRLALGSAAADIQASALNSPSP
jgi:Fe-S-cluster containining protein